MSKHTDGPWLVCDGREHAVETADGYWVCDCIETIDNARLIAAAPELLEALRKCLAAIPQGKTAHKWETEAADAARAAIAKATGDTQ